MIKNLKDHEESACQLPDPRPDRGGDNRNGGLNRLNTFALDEMHRIVDLPMIRNDVHGRQKNSTAWKAGKNQRAELQNTSRGKVQ